MRIPVISWILCVLLGIGLLAWSGTRVVPVAPATSTSGQALIGGPFQLIDTNGKPRTDRDFRGKYTLIYFGFTHCPDICPTTLIVMENALKALGKKRARVVPIFITLDPGRDRPEIIGKYIAHFGDDLVGLTGSDAQIRQAADAYKIYYRRVEQPDSAMKYVIDHSGFIYLMGPDGRYITHFTHGTPEQILTEKLKAAIT